MAIAKVQSFTTIGTSVVTTLTSGAFTALTTGNVLIVGVSCNFISSVSVNSGTVEWDYIHQSVSANAVALTIAIGRIISGGATTATVNVENTTATIAFVGIEFSGFTRHRIDNSARSNGTTSPASSGALATTASANQLWLGAVAARNDTFSTETINTVAKDFQVSAITTFGTTTANRSVDVFYRIVAATGAPNCSVTLGATTVWQCCLVALEETPVGGGGGSRAYTFA